MTKIGYVPEILEVKSHLEKMKLKGLIDNWELPHENLLTRITAAVFFIETSDNQEVRELWESLGRFTDLRYRENESGSNISNMKWRVEFNREERH